MVRSSLQQELFTLSMKGPLKEIRMGTFRYLRNVRASMLNH